MSFLLVSGQLLTYLSQKLFEFYHQFRKCSPPAHKPEFFYLFLFKMEVPSCLYRSKSPQSPANVASRSNDIDIVDLCTDHEQFDLEVNAGK